MTSLEAPGADAALPPFGLAHPSPRHPARQGARLLAGILRAGSLVLFAAIVLFFAVRAPFFLSVGNFGAILAQSAILGVLGFGLTVVLIAGGTDVVSGGIDLSLAGNLGLSAAVYAVAAQDITAGSGGAELWPVLAALGTGLSIGGLNALSIVGLGMLPLLATLAVMNVCAGLELVLTENVTIPVATGVTDVLSGTGPFGVPALGWGFVAVFLVLAVAVRSTPFGLRLYAVGGHREAAKAAGIPIGGYVAASYLLSGLLGAVGGIFSVTFLSGSTSGSGEILLSVVATAFLGIVFSRRLVPTIGGTLAATLFLGMLMNGFQLMRLSSYWVSGIEGVLILLVVAATTRLGRRRDGR